MGNGSDTVDGTREERVAELIGADAARKLFNPNADDDVEARAFAERIVGATDVELASLTGTSDPALMAWLRDLFADEAAGGAR